MSQKIHYFMQLMYASKFFILKTKGKCSSQSPARAAWACLCLCPFPQALSTPFQSVTLTVSPSPFWDVNGCLKHGLMGNSQMRGSGNLDLNWDDLHTGGHWSCLCLDGGHCSQDTIRSNDVCWSLLNLFHRLDWFHFLFSRRLSEEGLTLRLNWVTGVCKEDGT